MNTFTVTEVNKAFKNKHFDTLLEAKNFFFAKVEEYKEFPCEYKELYLYTHCDPDNSFCSPKMSAVVENGVSDVN